VIHLRWASILAIKAPKNSEQVEIEHRKCLRPKYILWIKSIHKKILYTHKKNEIDRILLLGHYTNYNQ